MKILLNLTAFGALFFMPGNAKALEKELLLNPIFEMVLENNPDVKAKLESINIASATALQEGLRPNPQANLELENFGGKDEKSGFKNAELSFSIEQEIEISGKRTHRKEVANYALEAVKQESISNILETLLTAQQAYANVVVANERLKLAQKRLSLAEQTHSAVKKRVSAAAASDIQHAKADIERKTALIKKMQEMENYTSAKLALSRILSTQPQIDDVNFEKFSNALSLPQKSELLESVENSPQTKSLQFKVLEAQSNVNLAKAYRTPNPTVGVGVRHENESNNNSFMATLSMPIPTFNRNQGSVAKALAEERKAKEELSSTKLSAVEVAQRIYENLTASYEAVNLYKSDILPSALKASELASTGYNSGRFSYLELLDTQRTLYEIQEAYFDNLLKFYHAKAQADFLMNTHASLIEQKLSLKTGEQK